LKYVLKNAISSQVKERRIPNVFDGMPDLKSVAPKDGLLFNGDALSSSVLLVCCDDCDDDWPNTWDEQLSRICLRTDDDVSNGISKDWPLSPNDELNNKPFKQIENQSIIKSIIESKFKFWIN
jgi:hypothetical protein